MGTMTARRPSTMPSKATIHSRLNHARDFFCVEDTKIDAGVVGEGLAVGDAEGLWVGDGAGAGTGWRVGDRVGSSVGDAAGAGTGWRVGDRVGSSSVGDGVGAATGWRVGDRVGSSVGDAAGAGTGWRVGDRVGSSVGDGAGAGTGWRVGEGLVGERDGCVDGLGVGEVVVPGTGTGGSQLFRYQRMSPINGNVTTKSVSPSPSMSPA
mmetsp:Transcript_13798/g.45005  ORF Transcript_13798/g.45005 Transcript_13798/m.45005 type:complete len:208 (-) Transcript_13798:1121-1744(-)